MAHSHIRTFAHSCFSAVLVLCTHFVSIETKAQGLTVTLSTAMYNGSEVPCFGKKEGVIQSSVQGGTGPYTYIWSNGESTPNLSGQPAGYYKLKVADGFGNIGEEEVTLNEPEPLKAEITPYVYPNDRNISCFDCFNGIIYVALEGGTGPYSYLWGDGNTSQNRFNCDAREYKVTITDANGCIEKLTTKLSQPERSDWTMSGNANTNPAIQYIGSSDEKDVVFKSNNIEGFRLLSDGQIKALSLTGEGDRPVYVDGSGVLKAGPGPIFELTEIPWYLGGNVDVTIDQNRIGPINAVDFILMTDLTERMRITAGGHSQFGGDLINWPLGIPNGRVGIQQGHGTWLTLNNRAATAGAPAGYWALHNPPEQNKIIWNFVDENGIALNNIFTLSNDGKVGVGATPIGDQFEIHTQLYRGGLSLINERTDANSATTLRFSKQSTSGITEKFALGTDFFLDGGDNFYLWDDESQKMRIWVDGTNGKVAIGDAPLSGDYKLYVEQGILTEKVRVAIRTEADWQDQVFEPNYSLMALSEVQRLIQKERHLPEMPSAKEMVANGLDVAKMDALLLKKIEELTLYILDLSERIHALEQRN